MNLRFFKVAAMLALPGLLATFALPAFATDVTFSTAGYFCATGTCTSADSTSATFDSGGNSVTIQATGDSYTALPIGNFDTFLEGIKFTATATNIATFNTSGDFSLVLTQTSPAAAGSPFTDSAVLSGTISFAAGATLTFNTDTFVLGGVTYDLGTTNDKFTISSPAGGGAGNASVSHLNLDVTATPEPTLYGMTGLGFVALIAMAIRRKNKIAVV